MRDTHSTLKILFLVFISVALMQCSTKETGKTLKLAHGLPVNHPVSKAMVFLSERCAELSHNQLRIKIYPGGQLGSEQQNVELLQIGSLAMTKVSAAVLEGFAPDYKAIGLPYLFRDKQHSFDVYDGDIGRDLLLCTEKKWIRGLCFYDAGSRSFYTKEKAITRPSDLSGLKVRVMKSKTAMEMVTALGGSPTPLSWGELYTALQSGVVDGAENNPPTFYSSHHYEVCKYFSLDEHASIPDVLIISKVVWDKLSKKEQDILTQAVKESVKVQRKLWADAENEALAALKKEGVQINYPDKQPFSDQVAKMYDGFKNQPIVYDYIKRIQATE